MVNKTKNKKLIEEERTRKNINFISKKNLAFFISFILIISSLMTIYLKGLNFGIDFTGGIVIEIRTEQPLDFKKIRPILNNGHFGEVTLQTIDNKGDVMIRLQGDEGNKEETIKSIKSILEKNIEGTIDYRKVDFVGPQVGEELIETGIIALALAFLAIMIYIWLRFEWQFSVGAILALIHDVTITIGLFSATQIEFNLTSIAAILIIIGYSINDSVVIFDRIRENLRRFNKKKIENLLNDSINDNLSRTILTSGTTIASLIALVTLGGNVIYGFSLAVLFGILIGTYSSIYIASPLLIFMNIRNEEKKNS